MRCSQSGLPNKSEARKSLLSQFFTDWFDTQERLTLFRRAVGLLLPDQR
jgi:hypothetical protein